MSELQYLNSKYSTACIATIKTFCELFLGWQQQSSHRKVLYNK